ncbi:hypothetical protein BC936DRAFT_140999 [Jimgerdemannia flammicorona]|uniref:Uncharacterized protein n=1 Tax=Jimgerdemannia flammicorona TaxID=994334 RepID=A0A433A322_9FUNG|nr:hypothetical protein BC936DRAFT_140999 [Jimgerdemannia flammicorona]
MIDSPLPQSFKIHLRAGSPQIIPRPFWCRTLLRKLAPTRVGGHSEAVDIGYLLGDSLCTDGWMDVSKQKAVAESISIT